VRVLTALSSIAILLPAAGSLAQIDTTRERNCWDCTASGEPRPVYGVGAALSQPLGQFAHSVHDGHGFDLHLAWRLGTKGAVVLRFEGASLRYGEQTQTIRFNAATGDRVQIDMTTANEIYWFSAGPELMRTHGRIRPYVNGGLGLADFNTNTSVNPQGQTDAIATSSNFDKRKLSYGAGIGMLVAVARYGDETAYIEAGARFHENGRARYLRPGAIENLPDGSIRVSPTTSAANFLTYHLGLSFNTRTGL
jgi:opacity protein-like surface antigen